jgi:uncharacterized SAM-binding protein YcdF (DUF218 family)
MSWLLLTIVVLAVLFVLYSILKTGLRLAFLLLALAFLLTVVSGAAVCWTAPDTEGVQPDYAVLLGCALENGEPREELIRRLELAKDWLDRTEGTTLMVTGGDPAGQGVTEASVMWDWLEDHGADMSRVILEDRAADTRQNLLFCRELAENLGLGTENVLILSSEYHQTRAQYLARSIGQAASGLSCDTPFFDHLEAAVREVYSFAKALLETL